MLHKSHRVIIDIDVCKVGNLKIKISAGKNKLYSCPVIPQMVVSAGSLSRRLACEGDLGRWGSPLGPL